MADGILSVGYIIFRTDHGNRELVETGTRVINTSADDRNIDWCSMRGEYYGAIVAVRAALPYTDNSLTIHVDCDEVGKWIRHGNDPFESYFKHALRSFAHRFDNFSVSIIHREYNEQAHEQARLGLKIGRELKAEASL